MSLQSLNTRNRLCCILPNDLFLLSQNSEVAEHIPHIKCHMNSLAKHVSFCKAEVGSQGWTNYVGMIEHDLRVTY